MTESDEAVRDEVYRVPKFQVPADVLLVGHEPIRISLHLSEHNERRTGWERPSDLLNGNKTFLPARAEEREVGLIRREAVMVLTVDAREEVEEGEGGAVPEGARRQRIRVYLEDGREVEGLVSYLRPAGQQRLQDFLNSAEQFFPLREGDAVRLVNKHRVLWIGPA